MENQENKLSEAIGKLNSYEPEERIWLHIDQRLNEIPLQHAVQKMQEYEPDESVWENIENKTIPQKKRKIWWYAAAMIFTISGLAIWTSINKEATSVSFSQESIDSRLQIDKEPATDNQYEQLISYCESETLVCNSMDFKRLKQEYEELRSASSKVKQAMGNYNTEPELMRQFSMLERGKAEVLNEMAKMI